MRPLSAHTVTDPDALRAVLDRVPRAGLRGGRPGARGGAALAGRPDPRRDRDGGRRAQRLGPRQPRDDDHPAARHLPLAQDAAMAIEGDLRRATGRIRARCAAEARPAGGGTCKRRTNPNGPRFCTECTSARIRRQTGAGVTNQVCRVLVQVARDARRSQPRSAAGAGATASSGDSSRASRVNSPASSSLSSGCHPAHTRSRLARRSSTSRPAISAPAGVTPTTRPRSSPAAGSRWSSPRSSSSRSARWPTSRGMSKSAQSCGIEPGGRCRTPARRTMKPRRGGGEVDPGALAEPGHQRAAALAPDEHAHRPGRLGQRVGGLGRREGLADAGAGVDRLAQRALLEHPAQHEGDRRPRRRRR